MAELYDKSLKNVLFGNLLEAAFDTKNRLGEYETHFNVGSLDLALKQRFLQLFLEVQKLWEQHKILKHCMVRKKFYPQGLCSIKSKEACFGLLLRGI